MRSPMIDRLLGRRDLLLERFAEAIVVEAGRRDGDPETRIRVDLRYPDLSGKQEGQPGR